MSYEFVISKRISNEACVGEFFHLQHSISPRVLIRTQRKAYIKRGYFSFHTHPLHSAAYFKDARIRFHSCRYPGRVLKNSGRHNPHSLERQIHFFTIHGFFLYQSCGYSIIGSARVITKEIIFMKNRMEGRRVYAE